MKTLILSTLVTLTTLAVSSVNFTEQFDSFGGVNEWSFYGNTASSGSHNGNLCFNSIAGSVLQRNRTYGAISPDFGTSFADSLCNRVDITFDVEMNIRPQDALYFLWYDYFNTTWYYVQVPSTGVWTINLNSEIQQFAFQLMTGGGGGLNGRYVHVDYVEFDCEEPIIFDADLLDVGCDTYDDYIEVDALFSDSTEIVFQTSNDGIEWSDVSTFNDYYATIEHKTNNVDNYYRVRYDDIKYSNTVHCTQTNVDVEEKLIKEVRYFNTLGQEISERDTYKQVHVMTKIYSDGSTKSEMMPKRTYK